MGGFWQGTHEDPTFIPLEEFISDRMLATDDFNMEDLVLEGVDGNGG